jgi:predicted nucleic acid-binding protein
MGDSVAVTAHFRFVRDPHDAKLLELALSGKVTHLLTADRDLLDLGSGIDEAAKRFCTRLRQLLILTPEQYFTNYLS